MALLHRPRIILFGDSLTQVHDPVGMRVILWIVAESVGYNIARMGSSIM